MKKIVFKEVIIFSVMFSVICLYANIPLQINAVEYNHAKRTEVIRNFLDNINQGEYKKNLSLFSREKYQESYKFYGNLSNVLKHTGIFDIQNVRNISIEEEAISLEEYPDLLLNYQKVDKVNIYRARGYLEVYEENDFYHTGIYSFYFVIDDFNKIVDFVTIEQLSVRSVSMYSSVNDIPVRGTSANLDSIKIYNKSTGKTKKIDFKEYIKQVTTCEVGFSGWDAQALRACAMAIKNYSIFRTKDPRHSEYGAAMCSTECCQVYDTSKKLIGKCNEAVDYIWSYFVFCAGRKTFPSFYVNKYVAGVYIKSFARKHGGVLSQNKAQSLAKDNDYSWQKIIRYFYNRTTSESYYNSNVPVGNVSFEYYGSK